MKLHQYILISSLVTAPFSAALAEQKSIKKEKQAVMSIKCLVELYGGGHTIYVEQMNVSKVSKIKQWLTNRDIDIVGGKKPFRVYDVKECVGAYDDFSSPLAKRIEAELPR
ncbi:hypothetical protein [Colwellia sp. MEBiC06753]